MAQLQKSAQDWVLLLQVDTEDSIDMMWGDSGSLYYWIRREDLRAGNWDAVWLILECY